jgi:4a-hydroxytetrahydrobiopterin dehydratase
MALQNLTEDELTNALAGLPAWTAEGNALVRTFEFDSFADAIAFVTRAAAAADEQDHHPDIDVRYTKVRIACSTHVTGGISPRDVQLARAVDAAAAPGHPRAP